MKENGRTLDISTDAGRENQAALDALAQSYLDQAAAVGVQQGSLEAAIPVLDRGREAFIRAAVAAGYNKEEAAALATELGLLPSNVQILIDANTSPAQQALDRFIRLNNGRSVRVNATVVNGPGFAYGGPTPPGPKHQIAGYVHAGEFVSTQETLAKPSNRAALEFMHAGGDIDRWVTPPTSVWRSAPQHMVAPATQAAPQSLEGVRITGRLDLGDGITGLIDGRIVAADRGTASTARGGVLR